MVMNFKLFNDLFYMNILYQHARIHIYSIIRFM